MTTLEKQQIRKIQTVLENINNGVNVFFNVSQFEKHGLVISKKKFGVDSTGNKINTGYSFHLTPKAKNYLNIVI